MLNSCTDSDAGAAAIKEEINRQEVALGASPDFSEESIEKLLASYESYVGLPDADNDSSVKYLMKAGEMAALIKQYDRSLGYYDQILHDYPQHPEASKALFMKAYTLDDGLQDYENAERLYRDFLEQYPEDEFADDAEFLLRNLGKSEEEIIRQFEAQ